jgi:hypothetical protein
MPQPFRLQQSCGALRSLALAAAASVALGATSTVRADTGVTITNYGHSALLIQGGGATVVLASSRLLDEGAAVASGRMLSSPGSYRVAGLTIEGIAAPHDRFGGRRFGNATLWRWRQGGLEFAHLGGTAAQLKPEDKVLLGKPDVLIIGVGGGAKVYDGAEAAAVVRELAPRRVIPVQYVSGKPPAQCDQGSVEPFLQAMAGTPVKRVGRVLSLPAKLSEGTQIELMRWGLSPAAVSPAAPQWRHRPA